ncbi:hypothetical protein [Acinetobacter shaoyimingii]|uniref:Uncharacterized protein n=1 Tax=Acinetobacter shaoyimingii TaxID=2715164 RepID=A0A6G8RUE8_9GAMM|nr:hypothetical protein [Acinetobacter shaoyimingii]QIO05450.1 hypothetical protein G8E00_05520 [Acinetobacter shaoyimingii]
MTTVEDHPVQLSEINQGLSVLNQRQKKLQVWSIIVSSLLLVSGIGLILHQDLVYSFLGLTQHVQQLHLPLSVGQAITDYQNQPDYLVNLLKWIGWFILKVLTAFIGAFIIIWILKKIRFFYVRFQSFVLKFVGWLIAFILIWSVLTWAQYDAHKDDKQAEYELIHYDQHIQQSLIAELMDNAETPETVQAYVLAQTALLHKPVDKDLATSYVAQLVKSERTNPQFIEYGFKPEQLWAMQNQIYGHAVTPMTKALDQRISRANSISNWVEIILMVLTSITFVISVFLYLLAKRLKNRALRIAQQIHQ